jgi:hypothetical protein
MRQRKRGDWMNVPIIDTTGIKEEGLIKPDIVLQNYEKLPSHIDTCLMLFDGHPNQELLDDSKVFFEFVGASYKLKQYIYQECPRKFPVQGYTVYVVTGGMNWTEI